MITIRGKGVYQAIAIGRISFLSGNVRDVKRENIEDTDAELGRFLIACTEAKKELSALFDKALDEIGEEDAQIFEIHKMMLEDPDFYESVVGVIKSQSVNAEYAVMVAAEQFSNMLSSMDDEYMQERATDVRDVSDRLLRWLIHADRQESVMGNELIICAEDLAPSETVQLDKTKVRAFVTKKGSVNSHTAILARTMNIPAIIGAGEELKKEYNGALAVVNGYTGEMIVDPDDETLLFYVKKQQEDAEKKARLTALIGTENITKDGQKIEIYANIGGLSDLRSVRENDAGGIGLFRSEFLYLERKDFPSEEVQFRAYKKILESMAGKKVIIRTMDIGADKQIDYFDLDKEENPALGYRAIRICLSRQDIFRTQLRALYRASVYGNLSIMFPMIISKEEIVKIKEIAEKVKAELDSENIPYSDTVEMGIMIETPAAAIISDILAPEVDFFSVGTNDLTQYTLAADRQNPKLDSVYDPHHEAVLRLIEYASNSAHKHGKWIGICGELGADITLTERFLKMGIDEISVTPSMVLSVRERVRNCKLS